jgi:hypothetical protein
MLHVSGIFNRKYEFKNSGVFIFIQDDKTYVERQDRVTKCLVAEGVPIFETYGQISTVIKDNIRGCNQKFPDWSPGARTANGIALCH